MTHKTRKLASISALATAVFLCDFGVYLLFNEFVAKLFLVIILISGAWTYYELRRAIVLPPDYESNEEKQEQHTNNNKIDKL